MAPDEGAGAGDGQGEEVGGRGVGVLGEQTLGAVAQLGVAVVTLHPTRLFNAPRAVSRAIAVAGARAMASVELGFALVELLEEVLLERGVVSIVVVVEVVIIGVGAIPGVVLLALLGWLGRLPGEARASAEHSAEEAGRCR